MMGDAGASPTTGLVARRRGRGMPVLSAIGSRLLDWQHVAAAAAVRGCFGGQNSMGDAGRWAMQDLSRRRDLLAPTAAAALIRRTSEPRPPFQSSVENCI